MKNKTFVVEYSVNGNNKVMEVNAGGLDTAKELAKKKVAIKKGEIVSVKQKIDRSNLE